MKTLKNGLKQENVDSIEIKKILTNYSKRDCVKVAFYCAEDCFHIKPSEENDLIKKWLEDEKSVTSEELRTAAANAYSTATTAAYSTATTAAYSTATTAAYAAAYAADAAYAAYATANAANAASRSFGVNRESKLEEYRNYARLFAYEDLSFQYRKEAKTFNLDDNDDLNIFLDFLTDNYPTAITYDREEYFKNKLAKEYLRVIYQ